MGRDFDAAKSRLGSPIHQSGTLYPAFSSGSKVVIPKSGLFSMKKLLDPAAIAAGSRSIRHATLMLVASPQTQQRRRTAFFFNGYRLNGRTTFMRFRFLSSSFSTQRLFGALLSIALPCLNAQAQEDSNFDIAGLQAIRGTVERTAGSSVYVKVHDGTVYQMQTGVNTHFVKNGAGAPTNSAHTGDMVLAGGELDAKKHTLGAVFVAVVDAAELAELDQRRAQWGKTWLAGTITAKRGTELEIKRPDGVVNTVTVDEDTSFRKRHQSITLPDIQVGDGMTASGVQGNGAFTAKVLTVVDAAEIREWSRLKDQ